MANHTFALHSIIYVFGMKYSILCFRAELITSSLNSKLEVRRAKGTLTPDSSQSVSSRPFMLPKAKGHAGGSSQIAAMRMQDRLVNVAVAHASHVTCVVSV